MMKFKYISSLFLIFALFASPALGQTGQQNSSAQPLQSIILKDGTTLKGHIIAVANETYTIQTPTMGAVQVKAKDIANISMSSVGSPQQTAQTAGSSNNALASPDLMKNVQDMKSTILSDPNMVGKLQDLTKDEEIMRLMQDPEFMQAVMSMDPEKIQNSPNFQQIMQNPKMQKMLQQIGQKFLPQQQTNP